MALDTIMTSTSIVNRMINSLPMSRSPHSRAYVTFLAGNDDDVKGVVGLAKGLRKARSKYPLVVAVLPDVPEEHRGILSHLGCTVKVIDPVEYPLANSTLTPKYVLRYSKLRIWEFVEYSKMIYLDGNIQMFKNIDHLFDDLPDGFLHAVLDCFCEENAWSHTPQFKIGYCQQCPDKVQWLTEFGPKPASYFNADMFVFEPSNATYNDLVNTLTITPPTPLAEQDFLNMFFKDSYSPIPPIYNLILPMLWHHPENIDVEQVKVSHYGGVDSKPQNEQNIDREDMKKLIQNWWDIYEDESLDYKNHSSSAAATEAEADEDVSQQQPFLVAPSETSGCCSIENLCLQPFMEALSRAADFCSIEDLCLRLHPFREALLDTGCDVIEHLSSLTEPYSRSRRFICRVVVSWF